jgi:hypothetical protein
MNVPDLRRLLIGGGALVAAAAAGLLTAIPAMADESASMTPLVACDSSLTVPCSADVTGPGSAMDYTVTLPGVGTILVTLDASGTIMTAVVSPLTGFTASPAEISEEGNHVSFTLTSTTGPTKVLEVSIKATPSATGGTPTVTAKVKAGETENETETETETEGAGGTEAKTVSTGKAKSGGGEHSGGGGGGD